MADDWDFTRDPLPSHGPTELPALPLVWTPEHVMARMIEAWHVLHRLRFRVGPRGFKSCWPQYIYDNQDRLAQESNMPGESNEENESRKKEERAMASARVILPPTAHEHSLMEEAFQWPMDYLRCKKQIALVEWSHRRARDGDTPPGMVITAQDEARTISGRLIAARRVVR
jgi:hypothetical protein